MNFANKKKLGASILSLTTLSWLSFGNEVDLRLAETPSGTYASSATALYINAGTEKKTAYFRFGGNPAIGTDDDEFHLKWDIAIEAPYDQETTSEPAILGDLDGLINSTTIQLNLASVFNIDANVPSGYDKKASALCGAFYNKATDDIQQRYQGKYGCTVQDIEDSYCKTQPLPGDGCKETDRFIAKEALDEIIKGFSQADAELQQSVVVSAHIIGAKLKYGKKSFKYKIENLEEPGILTDADVTEDPWSISAYYHFLYGHSVFGFGAEYQESFTAQSAQQICSPTALPVDSLACSNVVLGGPASQRKKLVFAEYRWADPDLKIGFAPKITRDVENGVTGYHVPFYLVHNKKGALTGGVSISYQTQTDEFTAGIFVGGDPFSFF